MSWWDQFFFEDVDMTSLAVFRILLGVLTVANAVSFWRTASHLLNPDSMLAFAAWEAAPPPRYFSVLRWLPRSNAAVYSVIAIYAISGALLCVGLATRWVTIAAFLSGISIQNRNRHVLYSGDALIRVLTFLLIFSDAGLVLSVDALLSPPASALAPAWPLRLMQLQIAALYLLSVWFKLPGRTWQQGTATHYATHLLAHRRRRLPTWLDQPIVHRVATYGTLAAELAGGTLIWFDATRYYTIGALVALHLSLQLLMRMHLFQWSMMASLVLFVPGDAMARLFAR